MPDLEILVRELEGETCRCGRRKRTGTTFCRPCYYRLPPEGRQCLYRRIGDGYAEAYEWACLVLDGDQNVPTAARQMV